MSVGLARSRSVRRLFKIRRASTGAIDAPGFRGDVVDFETRWLPPPTLNDRLSVSRIAVVKGTRAIPFCHDGSRFRVLPLRDPALHTWHVSYVASIPLSPPSLRHFIHFSYRIRVPRVRASQRPNLASGFKSGSVMYRPPTACLPASRRKENWPKNMTPPGEISPEYRRQLLPGETSREQRNKRR